MLKNHKSFTIDFNRTGIFGSRYTPRVLWLGMQNTPQELYDLEEDLLTTFDNIGYLRDRQNFVPHITLGRIKKVRRAIGQVAHDGVSSHFVELA